MICCDKCKKPIYNAQTIVGNEIREDKNQVTFHVERIADNGCGFQKMGSVWHSHKYTLDLCPDCQEEAIKNILGYVPWAEGK